ALFQQVKSGTFEFHSPYWDHISDAAKDFIRLMLTVDPNIRPAAKTLLKLPWIAGPNVGNVQLEAALRQLRQFNAHRRLKAASIAVMTSVTFGVAPKQSPSDEP
ncbi:hypothetical protein DYB28_015063, partial [Aphanomyces astaci]